MPRRTTDLCGDSVINNFCSLINVSRNLSIKRSCKLARPYDMGGFEKSWIVRNRFSRIAVSK